MSLLPQCRKSDQSRSHQTGQSMFPLQALRYTSESKDRGYPESMRRQAVRLYADGVNLRRIARQLGVNRQSVVNWINAYSDRLPGEPPLPEQSAII